jgi:hypothetical protein
MKMADNRMKTGETGAAGEAGTTGAAEKTRKTGAEGQRATDPVFPDQSMVNHYSSFYSTF